MLKAAQLYQEELKKEILKTWYQEDSMYYNGSCFDKINELSNNNYDEYNFVSVDTNGNMCGYISYDIDRVSNKAYNFGIISFKVNPIVFLKDVLQTVDDIFNKYRIRKIEFFCYEDNPAVKAYDKFINKYGGKRTGYLKDTCQLRDGKLHSSIIYELFNKDYNKDKGEHNE